MQLLTNIRIKYKVSSDLFANQLTNIPTTGPIDN